MTERTRRGAMALALVASAVTTFTLFEVAPVSAATNVNVSVSGGGSSGWLFLDSGYAGCGGGGAYDAGYDWNASNTLTTGTAAPHSVPPPSVPTTVAACGSSKLNVVRAELYPNAPAYDIWSGNFGGAASQTQLSVDGANWLNFGQLVLPTIGQLDAFRITGDIVSSTPVPDSRLKIEIFQIPCSYPDVCIQPKQTSTGAFVGAFSAGFNIGNQWSGSVGWPGRYTVFVEDRTTGRKVQGMMEIAAGQVPALDLDAPCFGMLICVYEFGGLATPTGGFHPLSPTRILDTRTGVGIDNGAVQPGDGRSSEVNPDFRRAATRNHELKVTGLAGIPATGVSAVLLNVTAAFPPTDGFVSVHPRPPGVGNIFSDQATYGEFPSSSNLNFSTSITAPNLVLAKVGAGGTIRFWYYGFAGLHIIADVAGWFDSSAAPMNAGGLGFTPVTPARVFDTRDGTGGKIGEFQPGDDRSVQVTNIAGIPANAQSVVVNLTAAAPSGIGYVTAYPDGTGQPDASNLNLTGGLTRANLAVVKVGSNGRIRLAAFESSVHLIVDVFGYYGPGGGLTTAIDPQRVADTRIGLNTPGSPYGPDETRSIRVAGVAGVPSNATAVILNVTGVAPTSWGWLTVWPSGLARPDASSINWPGGTVIPNMVIVGVGAGGYISIYNSLGQVDVLVDVFGYVV